MLKLNKKQWRLFEKLRRKHNVSKEFLRHNIHDILKFLWYEMRPRIVIRRYAIRKKNCVFLDYYRLRRVLYDENNRKLLKRKRQNIKQWSKRMVACQRRSIGVQEYVVEELLAKKEKDDHEELSSEEDITKKLKKQLELLKNGRRSTTLMLTPNHNTGNNDIKNENNNNQKQNDRGDDNDNNDCNDFLICNKQQESVSIVVPGQNSMKMVPEKELTLTSNTESLISIQQQQKEQKQQKSVTECLSHIGTKDSYFKEESNIRNMQTQISKDYVKTNNSGSFLDVLMSKVAIVVDSGSNASNGNDVDNKINKNNGKKNVKTPLQAKENSCDTLAFSDSTDGFLGFDETDRVPGMLMTPIVPQCNKSQNENSAFVSEMLNEYMRVNDLDNFHSNNEDHQHQSQQQQLALSFKKTETEGLVTPKCTPPTLHMPAVPKALLKLRTVAERKQYLQRFAKNHRLSIINNEAVIYRELQRKLKTRQAKNASQTIHQLNSSLMPFTRNGWQAASFINTDFYKYYYQIIDIDHGKYLARLRGVYGNNECFHKKCHVSFHEPKLPELEMKCPNNCVDAKLHQNFKTIRTIVPNTPKKLFNDVLQGALKPFQKSLDDDTAALLLTGGSMSVVRMPLIELEVFPENGKPLHEIAKRYLQYILPHHDISREWADFSVSALETQDDQCRAESMDDMSKPLRKSFTFIIPYNNNRNHVLVRRVVDRSEKLDKLFEKITDANLHENILKENLTFRRHFDGLPISELNSVDVDCADMLSEMINSVAISCSENSFIKEDPHNTYVTNTADSLDDINMQQHRQHKTPMLEPSTASLSSSALSSSSCAGWSSIGNNKKQHRLLLELRRLNATIIDAATKKDQETKSCNKEYCRLGCICSSLESGYVLREHCGKSKCMFECTCKTASQSRIMRLETDGQCITTEDAFLLRRKATARLARMEKEFTSTVVLTGNETLLINETNNDKKRRCTKAPKRYEDTANIEGDDNQILVNQRLAPKKLPSKTIHNVSNTSITTSTNANTIEEMDPNTNININAKNGDCVAIDLNEWESPIYVKDTILEQLKHCTVNLVPLEDTSNMVSWCMVHELYKCFCKGRAVSGKPFIIEKEILNTTAVNNNINDVVEVSETEKCFKGNDDNSCISTHDNGIYNNKRKRNIKRIEKSGNRCENHNFDITDIDIDQNNFTDECNKVKQNKIMNQLNETTIITKNVKNKRSSSDNTNNNENDDVDNCTVLTKRPRLLMEDEKNRYYYKKKTLPRRLIPIPRHIYLYKNRSRRLEVIDQIQRNETSDIRLLLQEHIMRSVYYHSTENKDCDDRNEEDNVNRDRTQNFIDKQKEQFITKENQAEAIVKATMSSTGHDEQQKTEKLLQMFFNLPQNNFTSLEIANHHNDGSLQDVVELLDDDDDNTDSGKNYNDNAFDLEINMNGYAKSTNENQKKSSVDVSAMPLKELASLRNDNTSATVTSNLIDNTEFPSNLTATETLKNNDMNVVVTPDIASTSTVHESHNDNYNESDKQHQKQKHPKVLINATCKIMEALAKELNMTTEQFLILYKDVIRVLNGMVCKKMYDISETFKRDSITLPQPRPGILSVMRWSNFLAAFMQHCMFMWQVKMKNERKFLVVTVNNMMPLVVDAVGVVNITALKIEKLPTMARMLLMNFQNENTQNLGTLMQGNATYWLVKGFIRGDAKYACFKPDPLTKPLLTKKINMLCCYLLKQRVFREKLNILKKMNATSTSIADNLTEDKVVETSNSCNAADSTSHGIDKCTNFHSEIVDRVGASNVSTDKMPIQPLHSLIESKETDIVLGTGVQEENNKTNARKRKLSLDSSLPNITQAATTATTTNVHDISNVATTPTGCQVNDNCSRTIPITRVVASSTIVPTQLEMAKTKPVTTKIGKFKVRSNIAIRKILQSDVDELHLPENHEYDHKWFVLDLCDDFTHIFVPDSKELLSLNRLEQVMAFAKQNEKIVKIRFNNFSVFDIFVTPNSGRKVYVGPLKLTADQPLFILFHSFNGSMMMREIFQEKYNNNKNDTNNKKTTAFWLLSINGQMHLEVDINDNSINEEAQQQKPLSEADINVCDKLEMTENPNSNINVNFNTSLSIRNDVNDDDDCMIIEDVIPVKEGTNDNVLIRPQPKNNNNEMEQLQQQSVGIEKRLNFTVQTVNNNEILQVTEDASSSLPLEHCKRFNQNLITQLPNNVSSNVLQHLTANNTSIKKLKMQAGTEMAKTIIPVSVTTAAISISSDNIIATTSIQEELGAVQTSSLIAPTTSASILLTKVVSIESSAPSNRPLLSSSSSSPSLPIILNKIDSASMPTMVNSNLNNVPIISSVYSAFTTDCITGSIRSTTTTLAPAKTAACVPIILKRRLSLDKHATVTTTEKLISATNVLKKKLSEDGDNGRTLTTTSKCNGQKRPFEFDIDVFNAKNTFKNIADNLDVTTSNTFLQTIYCTANTKLTDNAMVTTNTNLTTTVTALMSAESSIPLKENICHKVLTKKDPNQKSLKNIASINDATISDCESPQQKQINNSELILTTTAETSLTMSNNQNNIKLYKNPIIKTSITETAGASTLTSAVSSEAVNKQTLSTQMIKLNVNNRCHRNSIGLPPPLLNYKDSAALPIKSNYNNSIKFRLVNCTKQMRMPNNGISSINSNSNISSSTKTINSINELKHFSAAATTTALQPPPLSLQQSYIPQQLPQLLPLSSIFSCNKVINKTDNKDSLSCLETKIQPNVIIKCNTTVTKPTITSTTPMENLPNIVKPLIIVKPLKGTVNSKSISCGTGLYNSKAITTACTVTTPITPAKSSIERVGKQCQDVVLPKLTLIRQKPKYGVTTVPTAKISKPLARLTVITPAVTAVTSTTVATTTVTTTAITTALTSILGKRPIKSTAVTSASQLPTLVTSNPIQPGTTKLNYTSNGIYNNIIVTTASAISGTFNATDTFPTPTQHGTIDVFDSSNGSDNNVICTTTVSAITATCNVTDTASTPTQYAATEVYHSFNESGNDVIVTSTSSDVSVTSNATYTASTLLPHKTKKLSYSSNEGNNNVTVTTTTSGVSANLNATDTVTTPPLHVQYGYVVAANIDKRFVAKRVKRSYFIKLPNDGIKRFERKANVSTYLNKYLENVKDCKDKLPVTWKFVPVSKSLQMQNHKKSIMRSILNNDSTGMPPNIVNRIKNDVQIVNSINNNSNIVVNADRVKANTSTNANNTMENNSLAAMVNNCTYSNSSNAISVNLKQSNFMNTKANLSTNVTETILIED